MDSPSAPNHAPRRGPRRVAFRVDGRVQGVGFRWSTQRAASTSSVTGWVRNEPDGAVCGEAQGNLETFLMFLQNGPPGSRVEWFDAVELPMIRDENGFEILR